MTRQTAHSARAYPRLRVDIPVKLVTQGGEVYGARIFDISVGGVFVHLTPDVRSVFKVGHWLKIDLPDGDDGTTLIGGEIRWTGINPDHSCEGFGFEFDRVKPELVARLWHDDGDAADG